MGGPRLVCPGPGGLFLHSPPGAAELPQPCRPVVAPASGFPCGFLPPSLVSSAFRLDGVGTPSSWVDRGLLVKGAGALLVALPYPSPPVLNANRVGLSLLTLLSGWTFLLRGLVVTPPKCPEFPNHATVNWGDVDHLIPGGSIPIEAGLAHLFAELPQGWDQSQCRDE